MVWGRLKHMKNTLKRLTLDAIEYKKYYEEYSYLYKQARDDLLREMKEKGIMRHDTKYYKVLRAKSNSVDEEKLEKKYPSIYLAGMECKFNLYKARKVMPTQLVNLAVYECGKEDKEHVKLQRKTRRTKGREIERFSPPVEIAERGDNAFAKSREYGEVSHFRPHARFKKRQFFKFRNNQKKKSLHKRRRVLQK